MNLQSMKKILKKIFFLPPIPTLLISIPAYGFVIYALMEESVTPAAAYVSYLLSAYALVITVTGVVRLICFIRQDMKENPLVRKVLGISVVNRYLREDVFRAEAALYQGFLINFCYAGVKMFSGIFYKSVWFASLAVYYILLAVMRLSLLHYVRKRGASGGDMVSEWKRYRLCGIILLFMNFALAGIIVLVVYQNSGFEYPGMLIYVMALYAFYAAIMAVRNVIRFRKFGSPVLSAAKAINLTAALVSMLSLETAMLTQFGAAEEADFRRIMTASTGAGVSIIVLGMAVYMIMHASRQIKAESSIRNANG